MNGDPAYNAGHSLGYLIGVVGMLVLFVAAGYWLSKRLSKDREYGDRVKWPIAAGWTLAVLGLLGQCSQRAQNAEQVSFDQLHSEKSNNG